MASCVISEGVIALPTVSLTPGFLQTATLKCASASVDFATSKLIAFRIVRMGTIVVLILVVGLLMLGGGGLLWLAVKQRQGSGITTSVKGPSAAASDTRLPFRWRYIIGPVAVLVVSVVAAVCFFRLLPARVIYGYGSGSGGREISRGLLLVVLLAPQFILTFLSAAVAHVVARVGSRFVKDGGTSVGVVESVGTIMSNMVVLPQMVLCYAMIDMFRFNAYGTHLPPLYVFAVIVMLVGGAALGFFFLRALQQARTAK